MMESAQKFFNLIASKASAQEIANQHKELHKAHIDLEEFIKIALSIETKKLEEMNREASEMGDQSKWLF
ncbi:MAG: hypothetical protein HWD61_11480 [Parachlamydiaceae bacterium]|nr:MAG: hypothetical protein HWD61_11480 [Parachlamydiaceae bacterium]